MSYTAARKDTTCQCEEREKSTVLSLRGNAISVFQMANPIARNAALFWGQVSPGVQKTQTASLGADPSTTKSPLPPHVAGGLDDGFPPTISDSRRNRTRNSRAYLAWRLRHAQSETSVNPTGCLKYGITNHVRGCIHKQTPQPKRPILDFILAAQHNGWV